MLGTYNKLRFAAGMFRREVLQLLDSLKSVPWESRSDIIKRIADHYLRCPLVHPISSSISNLASRVSVAVAVDRSVIRRQFLSELGGE
jgi:hypothetical protein